MSVVNSTEPVGSSRRPEYEKAARRLKPSRPRTPSAPVRAGGVFALGKARTLRCGGKRRGPASETGPRGASWGGVELGSANQVIMRILNEGGVRAIDKMRASRSVALPPPGSYHPVKVVWSVRV